MTPYRRALVSELSFAIFRTAEQTGRTITAHYPREPEVRLLARATRERLEMMDGRNMRVGGARALERDEARRIAERIQEFFHKVEPSRPLVLDPTFPGCGFVEASQGDLVAGHVLYELKAGDRSFRSIDFRQLLTYCALNHLTQTYRLSHVAVLNPRHGTYFRCEIDEAAQAVSGLTGAELFDEIIQFVAGGAISK